MTTLKDLTWENHKKAEQTPIMQLLLKNQISNSLYCDLIFTKYMIYSNIESRIYFATPCLRRAQAALNDWQGMQYSIPNDFASLDQYLARLREVSQDQLWAHVYVHYLAPLYGGQIIKRVISGRFPTSMYEFDDPQAAIHEVRLHTDVQLAPEANLAFESTTEYYTDLYEIHKHDKLHSPN